MSYTLTHTAHAAADQLRRLAAEGRQALHHGEDAREALARLVERIEAVSNQVEHALAPARRGAR